MCKFLEDLQYSVFRLFRIWKYPSPTLSLLTIPQGAGTSSIELHRETRNFNATSLQGGSFLRLVEIFKVLEVIKVTDTPRKSF